MPGMSGHELAQRIVRRAPRTRVLFISGYTDKDAGLAEGASFLAKPFTPAELLARIQSLLS